MDPGKPRVRLLGFGGCAGPGVATVGGRSRGRACGWWRSVSTTIQNCSSSKTPSGLHGCAATRVSQKANPRNKSTRPVRNFPGGFYLVSQRPQDLWESVASELIICVVAVCPTNHCARRARRLLPSLVARSLSPVAEGGGVLAHRCHLRLRCRAHVLKRPYPADRCPWSAVF